MGGCHLVSFSPTNRPEVRAAGPWCTSARLAPGQRGRDRRALRSPPDTRRNPRLVDAGGMGIGCKVGAANVALGAGCGYVFKKEEINGAL